ncbi:hypothetical protein SODALDRAFT_44247 [Sodiomyces alkalinus F11]|uniref:Uncharacterized protein n=1 Tax=Sodiomyces alkalinus (strain CBS 110278 / VKM F-3762 / F11) TaxID=1314773 RepID=A0A3N2QA59_SODAK|nr:hypothetical protein SODALDRAFT_44247 [Sodiomyces alkalinus F11]ROT43654.1 hypothetical protein SODALDRAFT_44247 [Sodiomyces alkalinus F11]
MSGNNGNSYTRSGVNSEGNSYRVGAPSESNSNPYHYSNQNARNGSYYYNNPNNSTYYDSGTGYSRYTAPSGNVRESYSGGSQGSKKSEARHPYVSGVRSSDAGQGPPSEVWVFVGLVVDLRKPREGERGEAERDKNNIIRTSATEAVNRKGCT